MGDNDFHHLVTCLLSVIKLASSQVPAQLAYTLKVDDKLQIDLIGLQPGFVNLRAIVGQLPGSTGNDTLLRLLYANAFAFEHPPVSIGIDPDTAHIMVWSRQALAELRDDTRCQWFDRFIRVASAVQAWLASADHSRGLEVDNGARAAARHQPRPPLGGKGGIIR
jgi:hypothetical protein